MSHKNINKLMCGIDQKHDKANIEDDKKKNVFK